MKSIINDFKRRMITSIIALSSLMSISNAKYERDPQGCGMVTSAVIKRKQDNSNG